MHRNDIMKFTNLKQLCKFGKFRTTEDKVNQNKLWITHQAFFFYQQYM